MTTFAPANDKRRLQGVLVQLVRMPACHAGGHEFEPRTHRKTASLSFRQRGCFVFVCEERERAPRQNRGEQWQRGRHVNGRRGMGRRGKERI